VVNWDGATLVARPAGVTDRPAHDDIIASSHHRNLFFFSVIKPHFSREIEKERDPKR